VNLAAIRRTPSPSETFVRRAKLPHAGRVGVGRPSAPARSSSNTVRVPTSEPRNRLHSCRLTVCSPHSCNAWFPGRLQPGRGTGHVAMKSSSWIGFSRAGPAVADRIGTPASSSPCARTATPVVIPYGTLSRDDGGHAQCRAPSSGRRTSRDLGDGIRREHGLVVVGQEGGSVRCSSSGGSYPAAEDHCRKVLRVRAVRHQEPTDLPRCPLGPGPIFHKRICHSWPPRDG